MYIWKRRSVLWASVGILSCALGTVLVFSFAEFLEDNHARSTEGVVALSSTVAHISKGDILALQETGLKSRHTYYWKITYDGDNTVRFTEDALVFPVERSYTLCGVDCSVETRVGDFAHVTLTERSDGVEVEWPEGQSWDFREHQ